MKLKPHSFVKIITNSSSVIYTEYSYSEEPAYELFQSILDLMGVDEKAKDIVKISASTNPSSRK